MVFIHKIRKYCRLILPFLIIGALINFTFYFTSNQFRIKTMKIINLDPPKTINNYLIEFGGEGEDDNQINKKMLINTTNCKIPDYPPWTFAARTLLEKRCGNYFKGEPNCREKHPHSWAYLRDSKIHINLTAVKESGYSWNSIRCCYRLIIRVEQSLEESDMNADKIIKYSDKCYPIKQPIQFLDHDFIRLHCLSTSQPTFGSIVSREFLANPKPDANALQKLEKWRERAKSFPEEPLPPNVIILGVDTMSRLNSQRNFKKTLEVLQSMGAVEMKGYTKVGGNTFPNTVGFLAGYTVDELRSFCYKHVAVPMDQCPYLFRPFNNLGYLTTTMEDVPLGTSFNFMKKGFVKKPVDFYLRPFMLAVMNYQPRPLRSYLRCLGAYQTEERILQYLDDILKITSSYKSPLFAHIWLAATSHECGTTPKYQDHIFAKNLQKITTNYENTIIIFLGDHGETYAEFRETVQGWYEDNLPMFWIYLPPNVRKDHPEWEQSLQINSNRLTSHFDLYKTLVEILRTFDKDNLGNDTYRKLKGQRGQSLFEPVPENRTCEDAKIPEGYCVCSEPEDMKIDDPLVINATNIVFNFIRNLLPYDKCEVPVLKEIKKGKMFKHPSLYMIYIVTFSTDPGNFVFEGTVREQVENQGKLEIANEVLRLNKMERRADCVKDPVLEKYCYCK